MTLREYLSTQSMTVSAFAAKAAVPASTISRILNRQREPGLELLKKIMEATDGCVMPNDFIEPDRSNSEAAQ